MAVSAERMPGVGVAGGVTEEKCWKGGTVVKKVCADVPSECSFLSLKLLGFCSTPGSHALGDKARSPTLATNDVEGHRALRNVRVQRGRQLRKTVTYRRYLKMNICR